MEKANESNFKPFVVRTQNIAKELVRTATSYGLKASSLDFNLLNVQTFMSKDGTPGNEEEISSDELATLNDKKLLATPNLTFRQTYEVEINFLCEEDPFSSLLMSIGANPSMSRLFATIKPGSTITYYEGIKKDLKKFINKRKLRANMLIRFWDESLNNEIIKFVASVQVEGTLVVKEKINLEVGECLEPKLTVNDKLIFHFKADDTPDEEAKVDHFNRDFMQGIKKDELLIEYIKPQAGTVGRNCRGVFIEASEPIIAHVPEFSISDKIEVVETDLSTQYVAKESGYIVFENNTYDIQVEMEVTEISFKTTGSIGAGIDTDVSINVKESDVFKDAIGAGMEVEVNEINVDGNVGNNAKIKACKVDIQGQTHQSSYIEADDITINIHKGKVKGVNIEITRLEQGIVEGEIVKIAQASGGKIIAKEVYIDTISSHVDIIARDKIEIKNFKGEENSFTITPILYEDELEGLSDTDEELILQERVVRSIKEEIDTKQKVLDDNARAISDLKKRLAHYKASGTKTPGAFIVKLKEFQNLQIQLVSLNDEYMQAKTKMGLLSQGTKRLQEDILKSKIINHDEYKGHNEIRFRILDPEQELYYVPRGTGANERCFVLKYDEDNETYEISSSEEIS
ncbi:DUF342 domain-containing protein [Sulfurimonas sp. MAG313]|nr:flagellar assembly protein A [Sulfurimonas sp. MAG313]MDF1882288.1 DUF342 domain-containing protein [Sulfurimonas sp. MAG313]